MPGLFDDLIPQQAAPQQAQSAGLFDDLIPKSSGMDKAKTIGADVAQSVGIALPQTAIGLAGLPGAAKGITGSLTDWIAGKLGASPETMAKVQATRENMPFDISKAAQPPQAIQSAVEKVTGPFYKPQTPYGEFANTATQFGLSGAALGAGAIPSALTGLASEAAGQATKGTAAEPYARLGTAIAAPIAGSAALRALTPLPMSAARAPAVAALQNEGVGLTAGQVTGSRPLQYFEQALGDIPGAGRGAATATERSAEQFTAAALRRAGENAPRATTDVVDNAFTRIGGNFDRLAARNTIHPDPQMGRDIRTAIDEYRGLVSPPNRAPIIENFEAEIGTALARNRQTIPGDVYQSLRSRIERAARGAGGQHEVADSLRDLRAALDTAMERSMARLGSPDLGAWREARNQYRNMLTIERAATGAGENAALGLISPAKLRQATVAMGRRAYARGQGDFADLARSGEAIMRPLPQSGTAPRSYAQHMPAAIGTALGGLAGGVPGAALGGLAALAGPPIAGRLLMSRPMQAYLGNQMFTGARQPVRTGSLSSLSSLSAFPPLAGP